jgi:hypothetical protein
MFIPRYNFAVGLPFSTLAFRLSGDSIRLPRNAFVDGEARSVVPLQ